MRVLATAIALVLAAATARAGTFVEALARHADADVAALRAQRTDAVARCTLGAIYGQRNDLPRAALYLTGCEDVELPADLAPQVEKIRRDVKKRIDDSDFAQIEVVTNPGGMTGEISALPGETFTTPATVYVPAGDYTVYASSEGVRLANTVHANKRSRGAVVIETGIKAAPTQPGTSKVDFSDENQIDAPNTGAPPDVKHKNMMPTKYQKRMTKVAAVNPDAIDDPLAVTETRRATRDYWLGVRLGGGVFDDDSASARAGVAVAATGRLAIARTTFLAGRLDWSRRGGEGTNAIDVIGGSAGIGRTVIDGRAIGLALLAQVRGDLRLADHRDAMSVSRAGAAAAVGAEAALPHTPFTAGVRFEQGLTTLVPGARDRALLLELGVDWR